MALRFESSISFDSLRLFVSQIKDFLSEKEKQYTHESEGCTWHPEFGAWMVESTPSRPYTNYVSDLLRVERNMLLRRKRLLSALKPNEIAPTVRISGYDLICLT